MISICTAVNYSYNHHYFGRNLDLEYHYQEAVVITPRNFPFPFKTTGTVAKHHALIGMATVADGYPLYYDATNEFGLSMAGLNFPGNAVYFQNKHDKDNIAPFEVIPWILGNCKNMDEAKLYLDNLNIVQIPFSKAYPLSPLHWIISYQDESLVIEQTDSGLSIYDNPVNVLTNNPPFPYHLTNLSSYRHLSARDSVNTFSRNLNLPVFSRGMGTIGLPGDLSSPSRFIRAAFMKENAVCEDKNIGPINQFFHILRTVSMPRGSVIVDGRYEITQYSSCCDTDAGIYYYTTYENSQITAVNMFHVDLNTKSLHQYALNTEPNIMYAN